jgi:hypothetical protein
MGMEFRNSDEAWALWLSYSGQKGFEVRKRYTNKRSYMAWLHHVNLFVQMRVFDQKTRGII